MYLGNKTAIITGASSGIGRATAVLFSKLGSNLVLSGRNEKELDETISRCQKGGYNSQIVKVVGDLADEKTCKNLVNECLSTFGKLTTLINNAAIFRLSNIKNTKMEEFDLVMNVNLRSVFILTQLCVPHLIQEKGSIVNVSSIAGSRSMPEILPYSLSKAALDQFTKCTALELSKHNVRVNSVNPGTIETNIHLRAGYSEEQYKLFLKHCKTTHALGRAGYPEEVAYAIAFLASDNASFITGELLHVDGGRHAMTPR